jgi:hypothetical protein
MGEVTPGDPLVEALRVSTYEIIESPDSESVREDVAKRFRNLCRDGVGLVSDSNAYSVGYYADKLGKLVRNNSDVEAGGWGYVLQKCGQLKNSARAITGTTTWRLKMLSRAMEIIHSCCGFKLHYDADYNDKKKKAFDICLQVDNVGWKGISPSDDAGKVLDSCTHMLGDLKKIYDMLRYNNTLRIDKPTPHKRDVVLHGRREVIECIKLALEETRESAERALRKGEGFGGSGRCCSRCGGALPVCMQ